jgi:hypothetical protein
MGIPLLSARTLIVAAASSLLACSLPTDMCACPPATFDAVVFGTVSAQDGSPVAGALVLAESEAAGCTVPRFSLAEARSGIGGRYRVYLRTPSEPKPGDCLQIRAMPPAQSSLEASDPVPFAVRFNVNQARDSVQVNLTLR